MGPILVEEADPIIPVRRDNIYPLSRLIYTQLWLSQSNASTSGRPPALPFTEGQLMDILERSIEACREFKVVVR